MQNQYVGDIGDFGKYGLLRAISGDPLRLGVVWYLFPDEPTKEPGKGDGKFIDYLCHPTAKERKLIECDPFLYDKLHKIVIDENDRRVVRVQEERNSSQRHGCTMTIACPTSQGNQATPENVDAQSGLTALWKPPRKRM